MMNQNVKYVNSVIYSYKTYKNIIISKTNVSVFLYLVVSSMVMRDDMMCSEFHISAESVKKRRSKFISHQIM